MHSPWYMAGRPTAVGKLNEPIFSVDGKFHYTIEQSNDPYEILLESDPLWYPLTYKAQYGSVPAEPQHIDDGTRADSGSIVVPRAAEFMGVPLRIVARSFDPSGALEPSRATNGWYSYTGGAVIVFNPPSGSLVSIGQWITVSANWTDPVGIAIALGETEFPPPPAKHGGLLYGSPTFQFQYGGSQLWSPLYISAQAFRGGVKVGPPGYAIYYHQPA